MEIPFTPLELVDMALASCARPDPMPHAPAGAGLRGPTQTPEEGRWRTRWGYATQINRSKLQTLFHAARTVMDVPTVEQAGRGNRIMRALYEGWGWETDAPQTGSDARRAANAWGTAGWEGARKRRAR